MTLIPTLTITHLLELIADVQLGGVEEHEDEVAAAGEPGRDVHKVVVALDALLLPAQHAWGHEGACGGGAWTVRVRGQGDPLSHGTTMGRGMYAQGRAGCYRQQAYTHTYTHTQSHMHTRTHSTHPTPPTHTRTWRVHQRDLLQQARGALAALKPAEEAGAKVVERLVGLVGRHRQRGARRPASQGKRSERVGTTCDIHLQHPFPPPKNAAHTTLGPTVSASIGRSESGVSAAFERQRAPSKASQVCACVIFGGGGSAEQHGQRGAGPHAGGGGREQVLGGQGLGPGEGHASSPASMAPGAQRAGAG